MLKHVLMVIRFYKNTNASRFCVAILNKRGLDHNMTQFNTKEQAALLLPLRVGGLVFSLHPECKQGGITLLMFMFFVAF